MLIAEAVGRALAALGVDTVFGLMGSGNLAVTNALRHAGRASHAAQHEGGDAHGYGRVSGRLAAWQPAPGPGADQHGDRPDRGGQEPHAAGIVLAPEMPAAAIRSNFRIDQVGLVEAVGAIAEPGARPRDGARRRRAGGALCARGAPRGRC